MAEMNAGAGPLHDGNDVRYRSGLRCREPGCGQPAGTAWSPYWCVACNAMRLERIRRFLAEMGQDKVTADG